MAPQVLASKPLLPPRRRRFPWRGALVAALVLVAVRLLLLESLVVASGSMEPLLHGDPVTGDHVLVVRHAWRLRAPQRFDLVVFERDAEDARANERVVVKRVAAVGGESVRIAAGELFVRAAGGAEAPVVKRYTEFRELLVPLWREPFDDTSLGRLVPLDAGRVELRAGELVLDGSGPGVVSGIELAGEAVAFDDGWLAADGTQHSGRNRVADLCFALDVVAEDATTCIGFEFALAEHRCELIAQPIAGVWRIDLVVTDRTGDSARATWSGTASPVAVGSSQRFEFWHVDGGIGAAIDGVVALEERLDRRSDLVFAGSDLGAPTIKIRNGRARLLGCEVLRDLHWTAPSDALYGCGAEACEVPEGRLFVLGDASDQSIDSRHYGTVAVAALRGRPLLVWRPTVRWRLL